MEKRFNLYSDGRLIIKEDETLKNLKNSKSVNTLRAYESDFRDFSAFCRKNNFIYLFRKMLITKHL